MQQPKWEEPGSVFSMEGTKHFPLKLFGRSASKGHASNPCGILHQTLGWRWNWYPPKQLTYPYISPFKDDDFPNISQVGYGSLRSLEPFLSGVPPVMTPWTEAKGLDSREYGSPERHRNPESRKKLKLFEVKGWLELSEFVVATWNSLWFTTFAAGFWICFL